MMTVNQVSKLTGVSVRTLQYYDKIGLLPAPSHTEAGYRLYDDDALARLQEILLFRELEFSLKDIISIINDPDHDKELALKQQIELLELKKTQLEGLIKLARGLISKEAEAMDFSAFDKAKLDEYAARAKEYWGNTPEYKEFEQKETVKTYEQRISDAEGLWDIFVGFGAIREKSPDSDEAQELVKRLQIYISDNYYTCSDEVLAGLGQAYGSGGEFTANIDSRSGEGTAEFASKAIAIYCSKK